MTNQHNQIASHQKSNMKNNDGKGDLTFNKAFNSWTKTIEVRARKKVDWKYIDSFKEHFSEYERKSMPLYELDRKILHYLTEVADKMPTQYDYLNCYRVIHNFVDHVGELQKKYNNKPILQATKQQIRLVILDHRPHFK